MDKFIVRLAIFVLNIYMSIVVVFALNGIDISEYDYLFTNSLMSGIVLTTLVHAQGRYHCVWARVLCYNLILTPLINYFDAQFSLFQTVESCIYTYVTTMAITILATIYLAIRHFRKVRKVLSKYGK